MASLVTTSPAISRPASFPFRGSSAGSLGDGAAAQDRHVWPEGRAQGVQDDRGLHLADRRHRDAQARREVGPGAGVLDGRPAGRDRVARTLRPMPATMSTVSEANRARATESSEKPRTDDISPDDVVPASSIPGYRPRIAVDHRPVIGIPRGEQQAGARDGAREDRLALLDDGVERALDVDVVAVTDRHAEHAGAPSCAAYTERG